MNALVVARRPTGDAWTRRRSCRQLAHAELDVAQVASAHLRRHDPADDSLAPVTGIADEEHDRLDALSGAAGGGATAARQLKQLRTQGGMQTILEARDDDTPFAWSEAEPLVTTERHLHPTADQRPVTVSLSPRVVLLGNHTQSKPGTGRDENSRQRDRLYVLRYSPPLTQWRWPP